MWADDLSKDLEVLQGDSRGPVLQATGVAEAKNHLEWA